MGKNKGGPPSRDLLKGEGRKERVRRGGVWTRRLLGVVSGERQTAWGGKEEMSSRNDVGGDSRDKKKMRQSTTKSAPEREATKKEEREGKENGGMKHACQGTADCKRRIGWKERHTKGQGRS